MTGLAHASIGGERAGAASRVIGQAGIESGSDVYSALNGCDSADAPTDTPRAFDRHVLASIIAVAATEDAAIWKQVGLAPAELVRLLARWFPHATLHLGAGTAPREDEEAGMVRDLLLANRSNDHDDESWWLAHMVARRAVEPNHLWEDLGLRNRGELSRMLERHFAPLAMRNTRGMRWKRFFYRMLCEDDGFLLCSTPVCSECCDFDNCFGEEGGEGRLARRRRADMNRATAL